MSHLEKYYKKLNTPQKVQKFLRTFSYNREFEGETLRSAEQALRAKTAHCFEATFVAAAILENYGYPPLLLSLESIDGIDHVLFLFEQNGKYGTISRSRDEGLHGRAPVFKTIRDLANSYYEPYIDDSGMVKSYQIASLDEMGVDWRNGKKNLWAAEQFLIKLKHIPLKNSKARYKKIAANYKKNGPLKSGKYWW